MSATQTGKGLERRYIGVKSKKSEGTELKEQSFAVSD